MVAANYELCIEQGATLLREFTWKDGNGDPVDVTGYTARMQVRKTKASDEVLLEATTENGYIVLGTTDGKFSLNVPATITAALEFTRAVYDVELIDDAGIVRRLLEGSVTVSKEVTR